MNQSPFVPLDPADLSSNAKAKGGPGRFIRQAEAPMRSPHASPSSLAQDSIAEFPLVGRDSEVRAIEAHLDAEGSDALPTLVIRGDPGVGKTRLIRVGTELAANRGIQVFHGCAFALDSGLSYAVLADGFVPFLRDMGSDSLQTLTRGRLAELYSLFPAAAEGAEIPELPATDSPEDTRATLFWGFAELLRGLARRQPVLVVAEDLQWADPSAIQLLHFAIRQLEGCAVRFICSSTTGLREANPSLLEFESSLSSAGLAAQMSLQPLSVEHIRRLVMETFGVSDDVCREFAARLYEWTEGSPLFATETLRSLVESDHLRLVDGVWHGWETDDFEPPTGVQDLVGGRLARLTPAAQRMAEVASAMSDRIRFGTLQVVVGIAEEEALDAVDQLRLRAIFKEGTTDDPRSFGFAHPLIRECIYSRLGGPRSQVIHREIGDALEAQNPEGATENAEELAYHFHRSGDHAPTGKAIRYLIVAGRKALDRHAGEEAAQHLAAALELADREESDGERSPKPMDVLPHLAKALQASGRYDEAIELWRRALRGRDGPVAGLKAARFRRRIGLACFFGGRYTEALEHYGTGLTQAESDPQLRASILLARGACLQELARWEEADADLNEVLAVARDDAGMRIRTRAHHRLGLQHMWTGRPAAAREHGWQAVEETRAADDLNGEFLSQWGLAVVEGLTGNLDEMGERAREARRVAEELRSPILELWTDELSLQEAHARGDWSAAVSLGEQSVAKARALGQRTFLPRLLVWTALPVLGRGDLETGRSLIEEAWELAGLDETEETSLDLHAAIPAFIGTVTLHLAEGDIPAATACGERGLQMADRSGAAIWSIHHLIPLLAQAYLWAGDLEGAQRVSRRLRHDAERMDHLLGLAWADACDALVTWLSGDIEAGSVGLRTAADQLQSIPMVFDAARLRRQLAGRLAELGRTAEALAELRRAHAVFRELGAVPELEKTRGMFRELETRPPPRSSTQGLGGLTGRELEIARLVASRQSNKAIAKELGISPRTVTTHLTNIYGKLEVSSRGKLVDLVRDRGWTSED